MRDYTSENDDVDSLLADATNLACALEVISWQLVQISLERDSELAELRDATVGISRALAMTLSRAMEMDAADRKTAKAIQAGDRVALFATRPWAFPER